MFDIVSVGHFSIDSIFLPDRHAPFIVLGGSVAYVSFAARRLDARVAVVSKVGDDFPVAYLWWLRQEGVDLSTVVKVENARTTRFELKYDNGLLNRTLRLNSKAPAITTDDVPDSLKAKVIHLAPIAGEITYEVAEKLKRHAEALSIDPQGLIRTFDENGNVSPKTSTDKHILELITIYKSSQAEIEALTNQQDLNSAIKAIHDYGVETVIVTLGVNGAVLSVENGICNIPACKTEKVVDPTGAGDAFIGGFLAEYVNGENLLRCACVGAAVASLVVEAPGPTFFGDKEQIYQRARMLYEKEIKG
ncbi:MAG: carbohydrate kinase family protein [Candidatus Bathyarchaeota archaeon]|nr:carbohydrate kinase family protein [Candidatus Bathyarchaeota archaeon A05DMB-5]MDH7557139.1 carbohydrate kinase family protein [Candidatus Bathyarchaeota archaeon]